MMVVSFFQRHKRKFMYRIYDKNMMMRMMRMKDLVQSKMTEAYKGNVRLVESIFQ